MAQWSDLISLVIYPLDVTLLVKFVLEKMMGFVNLGTVMQKVVSDHAREKFGEFRSTFMSMLDVTLYERIILSTIQRVSFNWFRYIHSSFGEGCL